MMTRKHFIQLAEGIGQAHARLDKIEAVCPCRFDREALYRLQDAIALICKQDNPAFDGPRFAAHVQKVRDDA